MNPISAICNSGCNKQFNITEMPTIKLGNDIEKTYFTCSHCQHEYVAYYSDEEIRKLQARIRRVQKRFADPNDNHQDAEKKEAALKEQIKQKMDELRKRVESCE